MEGQHATEAGICGACGLCCDGSFFGHVEVTSAEEPALRRHVLPLFPQGRVLAFAQPCACFDGQLCTIYADRPKRCRLFECGLLKRVENGGLTPCAALKKIAQARARAGNVRDLLRQSGQRDEAMALTHRYAEAMSAPVDLSVPDAAEVRGELMLAVSDLMQLLERDFLR